MAGLSSEDETMSKSLKSEELRLCPGLGFSQICGGKYKIRILWVLNQRPHRYGEICRSMSKGSLGKPVTPRVLSRELKQLQERGLIHRRQFDVVPPRVEYSLTERGRQLQPILKAIVAWGLTGAHEEILGLRPPRRTRAKPEEQLQSQERPTS
ncbi:MAG TPA: helix-turn-helix domain-containing protein [Steroidobacteraceae bacterium]|nr:helix-turn-helix domain-containing protein [Steroidobacteraceae bacterium]